MSREKKYKQYLYIQKIYNKLHQTALQATNKIMHESKLEQLTEKCVVIYP